MIADNEHDKEAIRAEMKGMEVVGYVANSSYTVKGFGLERVLW